MSLEYKAAQVLAQSKLIDASIEKLQVEYANQMQGEPDEEDALYQLAMATIRQVLDNQRLLTLMLQLLLMELAPARYYAP